VVLRRPAAVSDYGYPCESTGDFAARCGDRRQGQLATKGTGHVRRTPGGSGAVTPSSPPRDVLLVPTGSPVPPRPGVPAVPVQPPAMGWASPRRQEAGAARLPHQLLDVFRRSDRKKRHPGGCWLLFL